MKLDPKEASRVWWGGTIKGAVRGLLAGLVIGAASALLLQFALIPVLPAIGEAFASFLTLTPGLASGWAGGVVPAASFSTIPLAIFSGVTGLIANAFASGKAAVNDYREQKLHQFQESKLRELEGREQMVEQVLTTSSPSVQALLEQGPRNHSSFVDAETQRAQNSPSSPSIH